METTKFIVIFTDANNTTLFTNDLKKSVTFAKLSKKYNYKVIETAKIKVQAEKEETDETANMQFVFNPFIATVLNRKWQDNLVIFSEMDKKIQETINKNNN